MYKEAVEQLLLQAISYRLAWRIQANKVGTENFRKGEGSLPTSATSSATKPQSSFAVSLKELARMCK